MKIRYNIPKTTKASEPKIKMRIYDGHKFDITKTLPLRIGHEYWRGGEKPFKDKRHYAPTVLDVKIRLENFEAFIKTSYNEANKTGVLIDQTWFADRIEEHFEGVKRTEFKYLSDFIQDYIDKVDGRHDFEIVGQMISPNTVRNYKATLNKLKDFEGGNKVPINGFSLRVYNRFRYQYLDNELDLGANTVKNHIKDIKSFLNKAKEQGYSIHSDINKKAFKKPSKETKAIYLNEAEISKIHNLKLKHDYLDNARDWLIIACRTGQRIGDLLKMKEITRESFQIALQILQSEGISSYRKIEIYFNTHKTSSRVEVPLSFEVAEILLKRSGLPHQISEQKLNLYIKEVGKEAGLTQMVLSEKQVQRKINGKTVSRKTEGHYPKYELITSHIGRRSYATNAYIKMVPINVIMGITGHTTTKQCENYIKMTGSDHLRALRAS